MNFNSPITELKGIGEKTQKLFSKIDINTIGELIYHFPRDYDVFSEPVKISSLCPGELYAVAGTVSGNISTRKIKNLYISNVSVKDDTGILHLTFFNMPFLKNVLKPGYTYIFRGIIQSRGADIYIEQPRFFSFEEYNKLTGVLQPIYSVTKGLTNKTVSKAVSQALEKYSSIDEFLPSEILLEYNLTDTKKALYDIHFPKNQDVMVEARRRLVFNEFFTFIMAMQVNKENTNNLPNNYRMYETSDTIEFLNKLSFPLTNAQKRVWKEIRDDIYGPYCMNRLIQGDVGSGKTIIALLALLLVASNGYQGALMAPTEVLASQHFESFLKYTDEYKLPFKPVLLVGSMTAKEKRDAYALIESGEANLIIGTHALIQGKVNYKNLALVITDEQHRFGVHQRESLANKGNNPHVLVMSATPIPRTLAIILYGDLQISVIDELPQNRLPIKNCVVNTGYRPTAYKFIEKEIRNGRQAYVICPMVEPSEENSSDLENVIEYSQKLRSVFSEDITVEYLHGKMKASEKNRIMNDFYQKKIDVLVSTTVIEVGINVPNASVMMVENAERFGLAGLHQLRGRVGRGEHQSYCIFINTKDNKDTNKRLNILNTSNDGFYIASEDLKLRGPGDMFGIRQSGEFKFKIGDIYTDSLILQNASDAVGKILSADPQLSSPENQNLLLYLNFEMSDNIDFRTI